MGSKVLPAKIGFKKVGMIDGCRDEAWNNFTMKRDSKRLSGAEGLLIGSAVFMMQKCSKQV